MNTRGRGARLAITTIAVAAIAVLIAAGAFGIYYYTTPPAGTSAASNTLSVGSATGAQKSVYAYTNSSGTYYFTNSSDLAPDSGGCVVNPQGQCVHAEGVWSNYLGYIPAGYVLAPRSPFSFVYPCASGMSPSQCKQFQATCGNGVCDPNESCSTCQIDCGVSGQLTCDPYSGRTAGPESVCLAHYCDPNGPE